MNARVKAALHYASLCMRVFPVQPRGKVPIVRGGFKAASVAPSQIESWWAQRPEANIGIATGHASGILVVDLDGLEALTAFKRLHGESSKEPLPRTPVVVTARGWHIYFAMGYGEPIRSSTGQDDEKGIDVRADGGYVLAPPSIHPSGHVYTWDFTLLDGTANPPLYSLVPLMPGQQTSGQPRRANVPAWIRQWAPARKRGTRRQKTAKDVGHAAGGSEWGPKPAWLKGWTTEGVGPKLRRAALPSWSPQEEERLRSALATIPADDYDRWVACGMALCDLRWIREGIDVGLEIFDWWSATCPEKYPGRTEIERKWLSFDRPYRGSKVSVASIFHRAKEGGWIENFEQPTSAASHCDRTGEEVHHEQGQQDQKNHQGQQDRTNQQEQAGQTGREQGDGAQPREGVSATPFQAFDFAKIPPRQWLYGRHYVRKYVTATVAPGGGAKTALKLAEAVSMAIGRDLLDGNKPIEQLRVWYWNGEDPLDEINRRLAAICVYYKLDVKELEGWLFIDSGHDMPICLATEDRGRVMIDGPSVSQINKTIEKNNIDAMILDPFISVHRVSENSNPLIDQVVKLLGKIANQNNCAIEIVHHVRKPSMGQHEITADDSRGGGAIVNAVRSCQVLNRMSKAEAEQARIEQDRRFRYFRIDSGKQNLAPPKKQNGGACNRLIFPMETTCR